MNIIHLQSIDSTSKEVLRRVFAGGLPDGTAILSDFQTHGSGRLQRIWQSRAGDNLLCSWWYHLETTLEDLNGFSLMPALAVTDWLKELGLECGCKWPNDVRYKRRKLCGILINCVPGQNGVQGVVIGIGLNLLSAPYLTDGGQPPVAVADILGSVPTPYEASSGIGKRLCWRRNRWLQGERREQIHEWLSRCDHFNEVASVTVNGKKTLGIMRALGDKGQLMFEHDGICQEIWADDIMPVKDLE